MRIEGGKGSEVEVEKEGKGGKRERWMTGERREEGKLSRREGKAIREKEVEVDRETGDAKRERVRG